MFAILYRFGPYLLYIVLLLCRGEICTHANMHSTKIKFIGGNIQADKQQQYVQELSGLVLPQWGRLEWGIARKGLQ